MEMGVMAKRINELEEQCKKLEMEQFDKNRKQIRKYVEAVNEKDCDISGLKREINSLKNKISNQEQQINNLNSTKENYELFVFKTVQGIKSTIK